MGQWVHSTRPIKTPEDTEKAEIGTRAWAVAISGVRRLAPKLVRLVLIRRFCHLKRLLAIKLTISRKLSEIKSKTLVFYPGKAINIILLYYEATYKKNVSWVRRDQVQVPLSRVYKNENYLKNDLYLVIMFVGLQMPNRQIRKKKGQAVPSVRNISSSSHMAHFKQCAEVFIWIPDLPFYERLKGNWINSVLSFPSVKI